MTNYVRCRVCGRWMWGKNRRKRMVQHARDAHAAIVIASQLREYGESERQKILDAERTPEESAARVDREPPDGAWYAMNRREIDRLVREYMESMP